MPRAILEYSSGSLSLRWEAPARSMLTWSVQAEPIIILPHLLTCLIQATTSTSRSLMTSLVGSPGYFTMELLWLGRRSAFLRHRRLMTFTYARGSQVTLARVGFIPG